MNPTLDLNRPQLPPILLDGATGTELERRGFRIDGAGWSAKAIVEAPELLESIHRDYVEAGAEIVTANTFRLHRRNLADMGAEEDQVRMVRTAVDIARRAAANRALVGASLAPLGDCYSPEQVPDPSRLEAEHRELAVELMRAGADLVLIETMVAGVEAEAAARAVKSTATPFLVSFVTGPGGRLLSGEPLGEVLQRIVPLNPIAIGINCVSCRHVNEALPTLIEHCRETALCIYANTGERADDGSWRVTTASEPAVYAGLAAGWMDRGVRLIGGCCGTTPGHIRSLQRLIAQRLERQGHSRFRRRFRG